MPNHRCCVHVKRVEAELDEASHKVCQLQRASEYDRRTRHLMQKRIERGCDRIDYWFKRYATKCEEVEELRGKLATVMGIASEVMVSAAPMAPYPADEVNGHDAYWAVESDSDGKAALPTPYDEMAENA
jgi:hypothetical protein